jgi:4-amino-4-deoxy-L-arabinose transferase-like glycosyltransferase
MNKIKSLKYKWDFLSLGLISLLSPLYFYKLGQSSLGSWDEAWYADIARNILESGNILLLHWNGAVYSDHPPAGFWIIALFESVFGMNEFGVRVGSAIFGLLGLYLVYFLGKEICNRSVGLLSAIALSSTYWYLYRSRSGNLDIFLTVFFVLTFYLAVKASKNSKFLTPFAISFAMLILTKSVIPLTIIPALIIIFWKSNLKQRDLIKPGLLLGLVTLPWFIAQYVYKPDAFFKYFLIGAPGVGKQTDYLSNFKQIKEHLHFGVGKWFWPGILGILAAPFTLNKYLIAISIFCFSFFAPFAFSEKGQLWHLIPLYPFIILAFFGFTFVISKIVIQKFLQKHQKFLNIFVIGGLSIFCLYLSQMQIKRAWYEFINIDKYITDEAILSKKAGEFSYKFYIDGPDFTPVAVFYSHKNVDKVWEDGLVSLFESNQPFVLITEQWRLDKFQIPESEYKFIASDRDKILIVRD